MTVASTQVRRRGLHREVVEVLGQRIVRGDYRPGEALPNESELGLTLEVSRTVVREAVKVLASKGLLSSRPKTGTRVLERANWSLIDPDVLTWQVDVAADIGLFRSLSEVRSIIEPQAAGLAASRRTAAEAERLLVLLSELDSAAEDMDRYVAADLELHAAILRVTHNELLAQMIGTIRVALDASRRISVRAPGGPRRAMPLHRDVVMAIRNGDPIAARDAMNDVITDTARDIEAVFGKDGGLEGMLGTGEEEH
jgi:GntR family transcriptional regulator, galactonate operon transcriptional repressor